MGNIYRFLFWDLSQILSKLNLKMLYRVDTIILILHMTKQKGKYSVRIMQLVSRGSKV